MQQRGTTQRPARTLPLMCGSDSPRTRFSTPPLRSRRLLYCNTGRSSATVLRRGRSTRNATLFGWSSSRRRIAASILKMYTQNRLETGPQAAGGNHPCPLQHGGAGNHAGPQVNSSVVPSHMAKTLPSAFSHSRTLDDRSNASSAIDSHMTNHPPDAPLKCSKAFFPTDSGSRNLLLLATGAGLLAATHDEQQCGPKTRRLGL